MGRSYGGPGYSLSAYFSFLRVYTITKRANCRMILSRYTLPEQATPGCGAPGETLTKNFIKNFGKTCVYHPIYRQASVCRQAPGCPRGQAPAGGNFFKSLIPA